MRVRTTNLGQARSIGSPSPLLHARLAGLLYLIIFVCGIFSELYVRSTLVVAGDAAATAENITASAGLFRVGFASDLVMAVSDVALAVLLYVLLAPVSRTLAMVATAFRLTQTAILGANLLNHFAALLLLSDAGYASAFAPEQLDALVVLSLDAHTYGYLIGLTFFGVHVLLLATLLYRSGYVPRILAVVLGFAALGYLTDSFGFFLVPGYDGAISPIILAPAFVGELALALWLLIRGVDVTQWTRRASAQTATPVPSEPDVPVHA